MHFSEVKGTAIKKRKADPKQKLKRGSPKRMAVSLGEAGHNSQPMETAPSSTQVRRSSRIRQRKNIPTYTELNIKETLAKPDTNILEQIKADDGVCNLQLIDQLKKTEEGKKLLKTISEKVYKKLRTYNSYADIDEETKTVLKVTESLYDISKGKELSDDQIDNDMQDVFGNTQLAIARNYKNAKTALKLYRSEFETPIEPEDQDPIFEALHTKLKTHNTDDLNSFLKNKYNAYRKPRRGVLKHIAIKNDSNREGCTIVHLLALYLTPKEFLASLDSGSPYLYNANMIDANKFTALEFLVTKIDNDVDKKRVLDIFKKGETKKTFQLEKKDLVPLEVYGDITIATHQELRLAKRVTDNTKVSEEDFERVEIQFGDKRLVVPIASKETPKKFGMGPSTKKNNHTEEDIKKLIQPYKLETSKMLSPKLNYALNKIKPKDEKQTFIASKIADSKFLELIDLLCCFSDLRDEELQVGTKYKITLPNSLYKFLIAFFLLDDFDEQVVNSDDQSKINNHFKNLKLILGPKDKVPKDKVPKEEVFIDNLLKDDALNDPLYKMLIHTRAEIGDGPWLKALYDQALSSIEEKKFKENAQDKAREGTLSEFNLESFHEMGVISAGSQVLFGLIDTAMGCATADKSLEDKYPLLHDLNYLSNKAIRLSNDSQSFMKEVLDNIEDKVFQLKKEQAKIKEDSPDWKSKNDEIEEYNALIDNVKKEDYFIKPYSELDDKIKECLPTNYITFAAMKNNSCLLNGILLCNTEHEKVVAELDAKIKEIFNDYTEISREEKQCVYARYYWENYVVKWQADPENLRYNGHLTKIEAEAEKVVVDPMEE